MKKAEILSFIIFKIKKLNGKIFLKSKCLIMKKTKAFKYNRKKFKSKFDLQSLFSIKAFQKIFKLKS